MAPKRIQRKRVRGWRMPAGAVSVTRGTRWGNPFRVDGTIDHAQAKRWGWEIGDDAKGTDGYGALVAFETVLLRSSASAARVRAELRGKSLACFCDREHACHADILLRIANDESRP